MRRPHVYPWPESEREAWDVKFYWWAIHLFFVGLIYLPLLAAIVCVARDGTK